MYPDILYLLLPAFIIIELIADVFIFRIVKDLAKKHLEIYRRMGFDVARDSMAWGLIANFRLPFARKDGLPELMRRRLNLLAVFRVISLCYALLLGHAVLSKS